MGGPTGPIINTASERLLGFFEQLALAKLAFSRFGAPIGAHGASWTPIYIYLIVLVLFLKIIKIHKIKESKNT